MERTRRDMDMLLRLLSGHACPLRKAAAKETIGAMPIRRQHQAIARPETLIGYTRRPGIGQWQRRKLGVMRQEQVCLFAILGRQDRAGRIHQSPARPHQFRAIAEQAALTAQNPRPDWRDRNASALPDCVARCRCRNRAHRAARDPPCLPTRAAGRASHRRRGSQCCELSRVQVLVRGARDGADRCRRHAARPDCAWLPPAAASCRRHRRTDQLRFHQASHRPVSQRVGLPHPAVRSCRRGRASSCRAARAPAGGCPAATSA